MIIFQRGEEFIFNLKRNQVIQKLPPDILPGCEIRYEKPAQQNGGIATKTIIDQALQIYSSPDSV